MVPYQPPRGRLHAHQALGEEIVPQTVPAIPVVGGCADRKIDVAQVGIGAHRRPHVGASGVGLRSTFPGLAAQLARARHGTEAPALLARPHVEGPYVSRWSGHVSRAVGDRRADDHHVPYDEGRRHDLVCAAVDRAPQTLDEIDPAFPAEPADGSTRACVECPEMRVPRGHEHPGASFIGPVGDSPGIEPEVGWAPCLPTRRIEHPELFARDRVDGGYHAQGGSNVEDAFGHQRSGLEGPDREAMLSDHGTVGRAPAPGDLEPIHVPGVDLIERGELGATQVAAVARPRAGRRTLLRMTGRLSPAECEGAQNHGSSHVSPEIAR